MLRIRLVANYKKKAFSYCLIKKECRAENYQGHSLIY